MKAFTAEELRQFPDALVPRLWVGLCERVRDPVRVMHRHGMRVVELLGCARYFIAPTSRLVHFAFGAGRGRFEAGHMRGFVNVGPPMSGDHWLALFAANWLIDRGADPGKKGIRGFMEDIRGTRAYRGLLGRADACRVAELIRPRLVEALDLDPRILAWAKLGIPRGERVAITSHEYTAAWRRAEGFQQVERENPVLLRPYAGAALAGELGHHDEPVCDLKRAFRQSGIGDAGWKTLLAANPEALAAPIPFAANDYVFEVYCWALQSSLYAGMVLPPSVMQRLAKPNGREPGRLESFHGDVLHESFWPAFLRAVGRRIEGVQSVAELRDYLDGEFEDVYDWLEWEDPEIDANQARAGWAWMARQHRAWSERERELALARREELRWNVPVPELEHGGFRVVALTDSYQLWEEGHALRHCVRMYANRCLEGGEVIVSIRDALGARVATGHVCPAPDAWVVKSVRTFANRPAGPALVAVAEAYARACTAAAPEACEPDLDLAAA